MLILKGFTKTFAFLGI